ncbi:MAG: AAA family ATPase, partial [Candidatus Sericytochromatia bacterium]|nr:AAA family ATPase [Candidatus Tanganyikabacteria bacterium]
MSLQIIWRKFLVPGPAQPHLTRGRLIEHMAAGRAPGCRLTVVRGGPGTGKTTLLADYTRSIESPLLWLGLAPGDRDPAAMAAHVLAGVADRVPDLSAQPRAILDSLGRSGLQATFGALCDELGDRPLVLVFDDAQHLGSDPDTLGGLETLVRYFPDPGQVILAGRGIPEIRMADLRLRGELLELDEEDLAFRPEEIDALVGFGPDVARDLCERTRGWAAGVAFAARGADRGPLQALDHPEALHAYLGEEFLSGDLAPLVQALMPLAFAPHLALSATGAEAVGGARRLAALRGFVRQTDAGLEINPLFREWLQREFVATRPLAEQATVFRALADRAEPGAAIGLLLRAGDVAEAQRILVEAFQPFLRDGREATVAEAPGCVPGATAPGVGVVAGHRGRVAAAVGELPGRGGTPGGRGAAGARRGGRRLPDHGPGFAGGRPRRPG